jgi:signal transduction histidine kinase
VQLTAWYVLTLGAIVVAFSLALYAALAAQLSEHQPDKADLAPDRQVERETSDFALSRLRFLLLTGNIVLLAGAAGGAYFLAGRTLRPIAIALERQRRFTGDASHELRTPLTVMRGAVDVALRRNRTPAAYREVLEELSEEVDAMTELVGRLLRLARGGSRLSAATVCCDVQGILEDIVRGTADLAHSRGDTVLLAPAAALIAAVDAPEIRQVFLNLVTNALQHTPTGAVVRLAGERRDDSIEVTVSDNGPGIPVEERAGVFEPFHRLQTTGVDGAGLGLTLCRELIEAGGGSITLEETAGGGATFRVRLPARRDELEHLDEMVGLG